MKIAYIIISFVFYFLAFEGVARASWIMVPPDGYGCPPGFDITTVDADSGSLTVCIPESTFDPEVIDGNSTDTEPTEEPYYEAIV